jgi:uncharacterized protein (UPF0332 family)
MNKDFNKKEDFDKSLIINYWIEKAYKTLEVAKYSFEKGFLDASIERTYFSAFYIVLGYLTLKSKLIKNKLDAIELFQKEITNKKLLSKDYGDLYKELYYKREKADYSPITNFSKDEVKELISKTEKFLKAMESLIKKEMNIMR